MDQEWLCSKSTGVLRTRNEKAKNFLARVSHISLQSLKLTHLEGLEAATGCRTLYAYDNQIQDLSPLSRLRKLSAAYLDNNHVVDLLGFAAPPPPTPHHLVHLDSGGGGGGGGGGPLPSPIEKLSLKRNAVARVHSAAARLLPSLAELYLGGQRLGGGSSLAIEPGALRAWAGSLRILDVSQCNLTTLRHLAALTSLQELRAGDNPVESLEDAMDVVKGLPYLETLEVKGCTFALPGAGGRPQGRYRDALVAVSHPSLSSLDGVEVTPSHRAFMRVKYGKSQARAAGMAASLYLTSKAGSQISQSQQQQQPLSAPFVWEDEGGEGGGGGSGGGVVTSVSHWSSSHQSSMVDIGGEGEGEGEGEGGSGVEGDEGGTRAPEDTLQLHASFSHGEGTEREDAASSSSSSSSSLGDTLVPEQRGEVRRASLHGGGELEVEGGGSEGENLPPTAAAPLPPRHPSSIASFSFPTASSSSSSSSTSSFSSSLSSSQVLKVGDASGFQSTINLDSSMWSDAPPPRRDFVDLHAHGSRWIGGFSSNTDREAARMLKEAQREEAEMERRRGKAARSGRRA